MRYVVRAQFNKVPKGDNTLTITLSDGTVERFAGADADHRWVDLSSRMCLILTMYFKESPTGKKVEWAE